MRLLIFSLILILYSKFIVSHVDVCVHIYVYIHTHTYTYLLDKLFLHGGIILKISSIILILTIILLNYKNNKNIIRIIVIWVLCIV